ncbi:MAG: aquaporin [Bacteroidetes bacterium]|nr:aquaporin [Bacteroidota bacterium]
MAVSFAFYIAGEFSFKDLVAYVIAQAIGAFAASALLHYLFPLNAGLGGTLPSIGITQSFIMEIILMYILMLVIFQVARRKKRCCGIAIGSVVLLEILFAGPISGASMNPIRSLAIISGNTPWIFYAPF